MTAVARLLAGGLLSPVADVVAGVLAAGAVLLSVWAWARHHHGSLGLTKWASGLAHGGAFAAVVALGLALAVWAPPTRAALISGAPADATDTWFVAALIVVPFGTVLFEEILFRGVLWSYLAARCRTRTVLAATSALYALWHMPPVLLDPTAAAGSTLSLPALLAGTLAVTFAAGILFGYLRARSGSLAAPVLAHIATNAFGYAAVAGALSINS